MKVSKERGKVTRGLPNIIEDHPKFSRLTDSEATSSPGSSPRSKLRSEKPLAKAAKMAPKIL